jgi:hypothetical protein
MRSGVTGAGSMIGRSLRASLATSSLAAITLTTANSAGQSDALALAERMLEMNPASRSSCKARVLPVPVPPTMTPRCQRRGSRDSHPSSDITRLQQAGGLGWKKHWCRKFHPSL